MKYTIIGAGGYIGSAMAAHLKALGAEVVTPPKNVLPDGSLGRVIYAAGATRDFLADPLYTLHAHVTQFASLLERDFDHCWYLSSVRLYDRSGTPTVDETSPIAVHTDVPRSVFDATKLAGETMALHAGRGRVGVARLACVYGGNTQTPAFIHELMAKAASGDTASGSHPEIERDYIHIDDVCRALAAPPTAAGVINFSSGHNVSNLELFDAIAATCGHRFTHKGTLPGYRPPPRIDNRRFVESFGFHPKPIQALIPQLFSRSSSL